MSTAVRRKPAPVVDAAALESNAKPAVLPTRHSFALYAASPLSTPSAQTTQASNTPSNASPPHYSRRRTQSTTTPMPTSSSTRTRLARLLLHHTSPRKPTISGPSPIEFPADLLPAELVALKGGARAVALVDLPTPPEIVSPATTQFSHSRSSHSSGGETELTTPPVSPAEEAPSLVTLLLRKQALGTSRSLDGHSVSFSGVRSPGKLSTSASELTASLDGHLCSPRRKPSVLRKSPSISSSLHSAPLHPLAPPTPAALARAARLPLVSPNGVRVQFGVLLGMSREALDLGASAVGGHASGPDVRRTLVVFLRHFWCPLCQDYMVALAGGVRAADAGVCPEHPADCPDQHFLERLIHSTTELGSQTHLLIIAPGSHTLAARYLQSFKFPQSSTIASVRIYVDPTPADGVYAALGMGWDGAPSSATEDASTCCAHETPENSVGHGSVSYVDPEASPSSYITHGLFAGIGSVLLRAVRSGLPVWAKGGDIKLLGGEFVMEYSANGSLRCTYAHRMQTPKGHAPVERVLAAAGLRMSSTPSESMGLWRWKKKSPPSTMTRSASTTILPQSTLAASILPRSASIVGTVSVPTSPPTSTSPPSRGFLNRFGGPRAGRLPLSKVSQSEAKSSVASNPTRSSIPRSASTPAAMGMFARATERVGVLLEGINEDEPLQPQRKREPAMPATLSASSSRPWALVGAARSSESLASSASSHSVSSKMPSKSSSGTTLPDGPLVCADPLADCDEGKIAFPRRSLGSASECGLGGSKAPLPAGSRNRRRTSSESARLDSQPHVITWEDVWMRARALSLVRLRARKDVRRGMKTSQSGLL
uniref:Uncharacterized protein n=1 Tax=Mycena chlorophos TaxID=658473 RepID=A0ABQ0MBC5_MYCCL|nr:predicted protein [Mycena chlorophos]